ncbi:NAD(P)/FAD-dependent oxidoreductase [Polymorphum gilvum]|uniref:FAD dependent oxidoreductase, putative n=1 Tax=Polymorphum gilvum (strain LMG 25793 / CGMCC 1.9160 / SL003B-26A1) TaxID=991905 RepID=F2J497_POLGS|nr:NAD(P)/FAD-dependent oxidoreductase [Polymorphum gilvum]ADZ71039.1 FAD dependent oxidoreductase, putative [Polymorphum gilvum SL003B-26A1]
MSDVETIVIGAGAVGLACARALALVGQEVMVLERHDLIGSETSARNSEVIHAGIYYPKDSLKARFCVAGREMLYAFCATRGVAHNRIGKLIVATDPGQVATLDEIRNKAAANGVVDLRLLSRDEARALEPALACHAALLSPSTGILDSHGYMLALQGDLEAHGGQVVLETQVTRIAAHPEGGYAVTVAADGGYTVSCRNLVVSAGLHASTLMGTLEGYEPPPTYFAKGNYFRLAGCAPFSRLIYPVPEPGGLGVHLTLDLGGQARFGPDVEWVEAIDYSVDARRSERFYASIRRYWPDLADASLAADYCGIRPKLENSGKTAADFRIDGPAVHGRPGLVVLYGIESPGLTSSLALGAHVATVLAGA